MADTVGTWFLHVFGMLYTFGEHSNMSWDVLTCYAAKKFSTCTKLFLPTSVWAPYELTHCSMSKVRTLRAIHMSNKFHGCSSLAGTRWQSQSIRESNHIHYKEWDEITYPFPKSTMYNVLPTILRHVWVRTLIGNDCYDQQWLYHCNDEWLPFNSGDSLIRWVSDHVLIYIEKICMLCLVCSKCFCIFYLMIE